MMENFLHSSEQGVEGNVILYDILQDGSIERRKYRFTDGKVDVSVSSQSSLE